MVPQSNSGAAPIYILLMSAIGVSATRNACFDEIAFVDMHKDGGGCGPIIEKNIGFNTKYNCDRDYTFRMDFIGFNRFLSKHKGAMILLQDAHDPNDHRWLHRYFARLIIPRRGIIVHAYLFVPRQGASNSHSHGPDDLPNVIDPLRGWKDTGEYYGRFHLWTKDITSTYDLVHTTHLGWGYVYVFNVECDIDMGKQRPTPSSPRLPSLTEQPCPGGKYKNSSLDYICLQCGLNEYQNELNKSYCKLCSDANISSINSTLCLGALSTKSTSTSKPSAGAITGITIGCILILCVILFLVKHRNDTHKLTVNDNFETQEIAKRESAANAIASEALSDLIVLREAKARRDSSQHESNGPFTNCYEIDNIDDDDDDDEVYCLPLRPTANCDSQCANNESSIEYVLPYSTLSLDSKSCKELKFEHAPMPTYVASNYGDSNGKAGYTKCLVTSSWSQQLYESRHCNITNDVSVHDMSGKRSIHT
eukprot:UC4_evm1s517